MIWDKNKKYTYADYLEWNHVGYRGMEILDGVPYQYGISVFEQEPIRFSPEVLQKILVNFFDQFRKCLKDTPYRVFLSRSIMLGDAEIIPNIVIMKDNDDVIMVAELAASEKHDRLQQYDERKIDCWVLYPDSQCISVYSLNRGKVYGNGDEIPVAATGCIFHMKDVWELPQ